MSSNFDLQTKIQRMILNKVNEPITRDTLSILLEGNLLDKTLFSTVSRGISRGIIKPDDLLVTSIDRCFTNSKFIRLVALALKKGANANLYTLANVTTTETVKMNSGKVIDKEVSKERMIHLLYYVYSNDFKLKKKFLVEKLRIKYPSFNLEEDNIPIDEDDIEELELEEEVQEDMDDEDMEEEEYYQGIAEQYDLDNKLKNLLEERAVNRKLYREEDIGVYEGNEEELEELEQGELDEEYVIEAESGELLNYEYSESKLLDIKKEVILLLILSGSDPELPLLDIKSEIENESAVKLLIRNDFLYNSVIKVFIVESKYIEEAEELLNFITETFARKGSIQNIIGEQYLAELAYLLDNVNYAKFAINSEVDEYELLVFSIKNHSTDVANHILSTINYEHFVYSDLLYVCLYSLNTSVVEDIVKRGGQPSYLLVDEIITRSLSTRKYKPLNTSIYNQFLIIFSKFGFGPDKEQLKLISRYSTATYKIISDNYAIPAWKSNCKVSGNKLNPTLAVLAKNLNIKSEDKKVVCDKLEELSKKEKNEIIMTSVSRQHLLLNLKDSDDVNVSDFGQLTQVCKNQELMKYPASSYPDYNVVSYVETDNSGNENKWCFTSDDFEDLIKYNKNPYTNKKLPTSLINEMKDKLRYLSKLGLNTKPVPIEEGVEGLKEGSLEGITEISKIRTNYLLKLLVRQFGIDKEEFMDNISAEDLQEGLVRVFGDNAISLNISNYEHSLNTFSAFVLNEITQTDGSINFPLLAKIVDAVGYDVENEEGENVGDVEEDI